MRAIKAVQYRERVHVEGSQIVTVQRERMLRSVKCVQYKKICVEGNDICTEIEL